MFYDKEIKTFHSYRAEVLEIVKNDFKEKCGCEFAENISYDQLPIKRGWHNHDRLDVCDNCCEAFDVIRDQLKDCQEEPYDQREGMYDNPSYYQSLTEK